MASSSTAKAAAKPPPPPAAPSRQNRMPLSAIQRGRVKAPLRITVHGPDGVGKSTFASCAPMPVFLGTEDGTHHLDVARFPTPTSWEDLLDAIRSLTEQQGPYRTLVLDSLDWAEPLLWRHVCERHSVASIEDIGGGYGKGYQVALDTWRVLLAALERMQREQGLHVVLVAHSFIKTFRNPEGQDFDRYILKVQEKAAALIREWCSGVYFANFEVFTQQDKAKRVRGVSTGARLLYTQRTAAYDAKDRYGLPELLPLSWPEFAAAVERGQPADPAALRTEIARKAKELGPELEKATLESLGRVGDDATKLAQLNDWCNGKLAQRAEKESAG